MRDDLTMWRHLSLAERKHNMIPALIIIILPVALFTNMD